MYRVNIAQNFLEEGSAELPPEHVLEEPTTYADIRCNMVSFNTNFNDWNWYYNYLTSNARYAVRNPKSYPTYLLALGYIPVVFLPSCYIQNSREMIKILEDMHIPHIKTAPYSFVIPKPNMKVVDAWVSKLDISQLFNIPVKDITSVEVVRRIYGDS